MPTLTLLDRIRQLVETPTAPFREEWMCEVLDRQLAEIPGLVFEADRFGNRIARLRKGNPRGTPATFVAHLDHPGFIFPNHEAHCSTGDNVYEAVFEGRVFDEFFEGAPVRLFRSPQDPGVRGRIVHAADTDPEQDNRAITIKAEENADGAILAMWDVPVFNVHDGMIRSRVCDDIVGAATIVHALARLAESSTADDIDIAAIFSRAEEAGFCGVMCLLDAGFPELLPRDGVFISVEISSEVPGVSAGDGAIIRIGDRSTTFDGKLVDAFWSLTKTRGVKARRALMDKGTCEATPFARAGLRTGGICIPVRNYHNMDFVNRQIAPEMVSATDAEALVNLITGLAEAYAEGAKAVPIVYNDFSLFLRKGRELLERVPLFAHPGE